MTEVTVEQECLDEKPIVKKKNYFEMFFATIIILLVGGYLYGVTFTTIPEENIRIVDTILGFLLGSVIAPIIIWAFRSSKAQIDRENAELQVSQIKNGKGGK
jgi:Na+/H+-dicarboxylate symporter